MANPGGIEEGKITKPCVCQLGIHAGLYKATGRANEHRQREFKCRLCGRTEWRPA